MNINYLSVWSKVSVYAHITQDDWALGSPEGLAHFDGSSWRWVARINDSNDFVIDMHRCDQFVLLFTAGGRLHRFHPDYGFQAGFDTRIADTLSASADLWDVSFHSASVQSDGRLVVVGTRGTVYCYSGEWTRVNAGVSSRLYCSVGEFPNNHIGGEGVALTCDGNRCFSITEFPGYTFLVSEIKVDGHWVGGAVRNGNGLLVFMDRDNRSESEITTDYPIESVLALADGSLYVKMTGQGVFRYMNDRLVPSLSNEVCPHRLYRYGDSVVVGGGTGGPNSLFALEREIWREIPIDLDMTFLDPS